MPTLVFTLTMPGRASWNGKWSGEGNLYAITKTFGSSKKAQEKIRSLDGKSFDYAWPDGWRACVEVKEVDAREAQRIRKRSKGFHGYGWMVDSILNYGAIYATHDEKPRVTNDPVS
jgi:hypothetical protein